MKLPDRKSKEGRAKYDSIVQGVLDSNREAVEKEVRAAIARRAKIKIEIKM